MYIILYRATYVHNPVINQHKILLLVGGDDHFLVPKVVLKGAMCLLGEGTEYTHNSQPASAAVVLSTAVDSATNKAGNGLKGIPTAGVHLSYYSGVLYCTYNRTCTVVVNRRGTAVATVE